MLQGSQTAHWEAVSRLLVLNSLMNIGKYVGFQWKRWENHRKMVVSWWFNGIVWDLPSGKQWHNELENHYAINGKNQYKLPCSIAMWNYQRVWFRKDISNSSYYGLQAKYHQLGAPACIRRPKQWCHCHCNHSRSCSFLGNSAWIATTIKLMEPMAIPDSP